MVRIGVAGYGYWGPNLVRNFAETPDCEVAAVADLDVAKLAVVKRRFPTAVTTTNFNDLLADASIDAIAIATPVNTHYELAMAALKAGKHVWVEKPMTETLEQAIAPLAIIGDNHHPVNGAKTPAASGSISRL